MACLLLVVAMVSHLMATTCPQHSTCQPGDLIVVTSASLNKADVKIFPKVILQPSKATSVNVETSLQTDPSGTTTSFVIPKDIPDGTYVIQIRETPNPTRDARSPSAVVIDDLVPSEIDVLHPTISAVSPAAVFADDRGVNRVTIIGSGFRRNASTFHFTKRETPQQCAMSTRSEQKKNCYDLNVDEEERQITLLLYSLDAQEGFYDGPQEFAIRVSGLDTNSSSFALIDTTPNLPIIVALTGLSLVVVIVYLLVRNGADAVTQTLGKKTYLLNALFLDVQTSSYSLSKCQFYAWTATAVLGYLFLVVSKSFVQGSPTFPDIPSGLPAILLASVGTAVLSTGITTTKGDKGAASPEPSLSDFISTGGVIAADRLQFAIWTVIGIGTFVAIIFKSDPRNINDLPSIPSGFLELMGISAGGYLVGKLVRKAGPTLNAIAISGTPTELSFQLTGSGLSQSAVFSVDGAVIYPDTIRRDAGSSSKLPNVVQVDPTIGDPSFARILQFTCLQSREEWLGGPHDFMITNPDSQRATISFKIFKVVDANLTAVGTTGNATLSLNGLWLDKKFLKVECIKNNGSAVEISEPEFSPEQTRYKASIAGVRMGDTLTVKVTDTAGVVVIRELIVLDAAAVSPKQVTPSRGGNGANATVASGVSSELAPSQPTSAVTKTNHNP